MKNLIIVGNWKSNKTLEEAGKWVDEISNANLNISENLAVVLCVPFTLLYPLNLKLKSSNLKLALGAQDVSPFPDGAYTGEVSAKQLADLGVTYVMIGHSERRKYFKEDDQMLANKVKEALDNNLTPIFCVQGKTTPVPEGVKIILYEPLEAIGTGMAGSPSEANEVARTLREISGNETIILYGGSVAPENVSQFCEQENIGGVAVGGASLDSNKFSEIIKNASNF